MRPGSRRGSGRSSSAPKVAALLKDLGFNVGDFGREVARSLVARGGEGGAEELRPEGSIAACGRRLGLILLRQRPLLQNVLKELVVCGKRVEIRAPQFIGAVRLRIHSRPGVSS
jgi:hypothetical protein